MNITFSPELITGLIALLTAGVSHYRLSRIPEKIIADAKIAAAGVIADALVASAKLQAEAKVVKEKL